MYPALGFADEAAAIEDEFVVAADGVDVNHRAAERAGGVDHERFADVVLVVMPRARGEVDHQIAFLRVELFHGIGAAVESARADHGVRPDVLANRDADAAAAVFDDEGFFGGFEIAVLVEDVVGRQQAFMRGGDDLAAMAEGGGVEGRAAGAGGVAFDGADERGDVADGGGDFAERVLAVGHEAALEQQIARRVTAHGELRIHDEFGALGDEGGVGGEDFTAVAGEVADDRVELSEAETHEGKGGTVHGFAGADNPAHGRTSNAEL